MSHDSTKILMGSHGSSDLVANPFASDPATFKAGLAVRLNSTSGLSTALADGALIGVSLGVDLSDTKKTTVARAGNMVPILVAPYLTKANLTFVSKVAEAVAIAFITGGVAGSEVVTVTGSAAAGWLISVSMATASSTATQLKAALDGAAAALALIETTIASGQGATAQAAFAQDDIDVVSHAAIGAAVRVSDVTGKAIPLAGGGAATGALYASAAKTALSYDTTAASPGSAAYIDMGGGL